MRYDLFLDDERFPAYIVTDRAVVICRTVESFIKTIRQLGLPVAFHLDHDLGPGGQGDTAMKWLLDWVLDQVESGVELHTPEFTIHSQNPIGAKTMRGYIKDIHQILSRE